uniref:Uncharacterized protein n=1 Tax=Daphnia galeata TaxID=27404 RepID=A0A8J2RCU0_9CRUS|nr:unnamed protein product [Daphnia galeata]
MASSITAMAQQQPFYPWSLPDSFTVYAFTLEEIRSLRKVTETVGMTNRLHSTKTEVSGTTQG